MDWLYRISLISGPLPVILTVLGVLGGVWLLGSNVRWYYRRAVPIAGLIALVIMIAVWITVEKVIVPFPDPIEMSIYVWIGIGIYALLLLGPRIKAGGTIAKAVVSVVATVLVIVTAATQINLVFAATRLWELRSDTTISTASHSVKFPVRPILLSPAIPPTRCGKRRRACRFAGGSRLCLSPGRFQDSPRAMRRCICRRRTSPIRVRFFPCSCSWQVSLASPRTGSRAES